VIVAHLRGYGSIHLLDVATSQAGQWGAIGADVTDLMNALIIGRAIIGRVRLVLRAARVAAALRLEWCLGLENSHRCCEPNHTRSAALRLHPAPAEEELTMPYKGSQGCGQSTLARSSPRIGQMSCIHIQRTSRIWLEVLAQVDV
jgi:hypothetical protein